MSTVAMGTGEHQSKISDFMAQERRRSSRSVRAEVRRIRRRLRKQAALYGSLPAETDSRRKLVSATREAVRRLWMSRQGRRIDLVGLLGQQRPDGKPAWALVDPALKAGEYSIRHSCHNGAYVPATTAKAGHFTIPCVYSDRYNVASHADITVELVGITTESYPFSIPPLPAKARKLASDRRIRRRARWVGLLYQPEGWMEVRPDPAIVVEWHDCQDEYYVLAVWGQDRPGIMEFVS